MDIPGLGVVQPDFAERNIIVDQLVALNKDTVDELAETGSLRRRLRRAPDAVDRLSAGLLG